MNEYSGVLTFGTNQDVEYNVKKCLKDAEMGGRYFIGPSHDILNLSWEKIFAMRTTIEKYQ